MNLYRQYVLSFGKSTQLGKNLYKEEGALFLQVSFHATYRLKGTQNMICVQHHSSQVKS